MELVLPTSKYKESFIRAVEEFQSSSELERGRGGWYEKLSPQGLEADFDSYVEGQRKHALGRDLPDGYVPETTYWLIDGGEYIGRVSIRHRLTDHLRSIGGHIGYDIRPSERGQGYGNKILELALPKAKELGIRKALLTCDETNIRSRNIIEKNGGILEDKVPNPETGIDKLRFWIDIG